MVGSIAPSNLAQNAVDDPFKKGVKAYEEGHIDDAIEKYAAVLRKAPAHAAAWLNLGTALRKKGYFESSVAATMRAVTLRPNDASGHTNLGNCLIDLDRQKEALEAHGRAYELAPDSFLIRRNYGVALRECGEFEKALELLDAAQELNTKGENIEWERAVALLHLALYKEGWAAFEARWKQPGMQERVWQTALRWRGEDLKDKTLLVYEEQGFGDSILCSRYLPLIAEHGAKVILEIRKPLHNLFLSLPGIIQIAEPGQIKSGFDYHIPIMSLPGIFGTDLSNIPPPTEFKVITAPPPAVQAALSAAKGMLKVGIVWSGSATFINNSKRAAKLERFLSFAEVPGVQLFSLQKGLYEADLKNSGATTLIPELGSMLNDFSETAATLKQLDLVIMTDSAVAHLAGSLGLPVWNLLHNRPYWLYLSDCTDTPWYPSMRLFRQKTPGDWDGVFSEALAALKDLARSRA